MPKAEDNAKFILLKKSDQKNNFKMWFVLALLFPFNSNLISIKHYNLVLILLSNAIIQINYLMQFQDKW